MVVKHNRSVVIPEWFRPCYDAVLRARKRVGPDRVKYALWDEIGNGRLVQIIEKDDRAAAERVARAMDKLK